MRITAEEARKKADLVTSKEACLSDIFQEIQKVSEQGGYCLRVYDGTTTGLSKLSNPEYLEYVVNSLEELGYKVSKNEVCLKINW